MAITSHKGMALLGEWIVCEKRPFMFMNILWARNCTYIHTYIYTYIDIISTNSDRKATYVLLKYTKKVINLIFGGYHHQLPYTFCKGMLACRGQRLAETN
jgi:hypothetical protein